MAAGGAVHRIVRRTLQALPDGPQALADGRISACPPRGRGGGGNLPPARDAAPARPVEPERRRQGDVAVLAADRGSVGRDRGARASKAARLELRGVRSVQIFRAAMLTAGRRRLQLRAELVSFFQHVGESFAQLPHQLLCARAKSSITATAST